MADVGLNFGKTPSYISGDNPGTLPSTGDLLIGALVQGNQPISVLGPNSMILKIKEMEAMLELLKREYEQSTKRSTLVTLAMPPPPPPPPIVVIPSRDLVREVKSRNSKGKVKREHSNMRV